MKSSCLYSTRHTRADQSELTSKCRCCRKVNNHAESVPAFSYPLLCLRPCGLLLLVALLWVHLPGLLPIFFPAITLCYVTLCHGMPCYAMLCHAAPCCAMLCHAVPCCAMLCHAVPPYAMLRHAVPCYAMEAFDLACTKAASTTPPEKLWGG